MREHRLDRPGDVDARGPAPGLAVQRRRPRATWAQTSAMCTQILCTPSASGLGRDRVVEVAGAGGIDREGGQRAQVAPLAGNREAAPAAARASCSSSGAKPAAQAAVEHQRLDHVAGPVGAADPAHHARPRAPRSAGLDEHDVPGPRTRRRPRGRVPPRCGQRRPAGPARGRGPRRGNIRSAVRKRPLRSSTATYVPAPRGEPRPESLAPRRGPSLTGLWQRAFPAPPSALGPRRGHWRRALRASPRPPGGPLPRRGCGRWA